MESKLHEIIELSTSASHDIVGVAIITPRQYCNGTETLEDYEVHTRLDVMELHPPPEYVLLTAHVFVRCYIFSNY